MTKTDVIKLFATIAAAYPRDSAFAAADQQMVGVWAEMLADVPYELVNVSLRAHVATSPFPPGISDIRGWAAKAVATEMDGAEAWGLVMDAVRKYGYYQEAEARRMLEGPVWDAFRRTFISWQHFCMSEDAVADRAHFIRMWESMARRRQEAKILPNSAKAVLAKTNILQIEGGENHGL